MQEVEPKIVMRIRNGESQTQIDVETERLNSEGIAVMYFNSQSSHDEWLNRFLALSQ
jgi:hypothetical protein